MKLITGLNNKKSGSLWYQYLATITGCLSIVCTGMHFGWPSPSLPQLLDKDSHIPMSSDDGSWMAVMPCIGAASGSLLAAYLVDRIGRKACMMLTSPLYFLAWVMVAFSQSVPLLNAARFLAGASDGLAYTAFPIYLCEVADPKIRGLMGSSIPFTAMLGLLLINVVGSYLSIKATALVSSIVPILHFCTFVFMPESPYYLIMKRQFDEARRSLQVFSGMEDVSAELSRLEFAVADDLEKAGRIWDLFTTRSNRRAVVVVAGLRAAQQFSGVNAITFYATTIFGEAGGPVPPHLASIAYFLVQLLMAGVSSILVDKLGRRPLLIVSLVGSGLALSAEGLYFYFDSCANFDMSSARYLPLVALLGYVVIFNLGMGTIPVLMLGELFPTSVKAFALCLADIYFGVLVTIVSKFFQIMKDDMGMHVPFFAFTACCALGLVFVIVSVPETNGKTLEEIQLQLKGEHMKDAKGDEAS